MNFVVIYGSVRTERQGIRAARFVVARLKERGHAVALIDPADSPLPLLDKMFKEYDEGQAPAVMQELHAKLEAADAYVVVSGEYNHSIPPALKNLLDHFQREYLFKPCGICTYSAGPFGGVRAGVHLRAVLGELGMVTPSVMFTVSRVRDAFDEQGQAVDQAYGRRLGRFLDELEWYADALKRKRAEGVPY